MSSSRRESNSVPQFTKLLRAPATRELGAGDGSRTHADGLEDRRAAVTLLRIRAKGRNRTDRAT